MSKKHILLWGEFGVGLLLLASPWIFGFSAVGSALLANVLGGSAIAIVSLWLIYWERLDNPMSK